MYYKQYGDTDMKVSAIGFGAMRFDEDDIAAGNFEKCAEIAVYANSQGINYFDSAPFYSEDKSEEVMGIALSQMKRNEVFITSKTNFSTLGQNPTRDDFRKRLETSLDRLQTDYIDFYHMWCMLNVESWERHMDVLYGFFEEAKSEGLIRNIVFSSHMQGNGVEKVVNSGKFKGVLLGYNAFNYRLRQSGIKSAYDNGMGVVVMNPLGGGMIPQNPELFSYLTKGTDLTVPQAALRFVAAHKEVTVTLAGFTTKEHVDDAVKAVSGLQEYPVEEITKQYEGDGLVLNDFCTGCGYCDHCPVDIEVPKFMDVYNIKLLREGDDSCYSRLKMHWNIEQEQAGKCIRCGKCEELCTQHLPIMDRLENIANMNFTRG